MFLYFQQTWWLEATSPYYLADSSQTPDGTVPYWHSLVLVGRLSVDTMLLPCFGQSPGVYISCTTRLRQTEVPNPKWLLLAIHGNISRRIKITQPTLKHLLLYGRGQNVAPLRVYSLPLRLNQTFRTLVALLQNPRSGWRATGWRGWVKRTTKQWPVQKQEKAVGYRHSGRHCWQHTCSHQWGPHTWCTPDGHQCNFLELTERYIDTHNEWQGNGPSHFTIDGKLSHRLKSRHGNRGSCDGDTQGGCRNSAGVTSISDPLHIVHVMA